jgi:hypothetical protein
VAAKTPAELRAEKGAVPVNRRVWSLVLRISVSRLPVSAAASNAANRASLSSSSIDLAHTELWSYIRALRVQGTTEEPKAFASSLSVAIPRWV